MLKTLTKKWSFVLLWLWIIAWIWNIIRFPLWVIEYWSAFLVVYTFLLFLWTSLLLVEVSLSQKYQKWRWSVLRSIYAWSRANIFSWGWVVFGFVLMSYSIVYLWRSLDYLWYSIVWLFSWNALWIPFAGEQGAFSFFTHTLLWTWSNYMVWWMFSLPVVVGTMWWVCLLWLLLRWWLFTYMRRSIHLTILMFWMLLILSAWVLFLPGALSHWWWLLHFDSSLLLHVSLWGDAFMHMVLSLILWCGLLWTFSRIKHRDSEIRRWVIAIVVWDYLISLIWLFLVWSFLSSTFAQTWISPIEWWMVSRWLLFWVIPDLLTQRWRWWYVFLSVFLIVCILLMITTLGWLAVYIRNSFNEQHMWHIQMRWNGGIWMLLSLVFLIWLLYTRSHGIFVMNLMWSYLYDILIPLCWIFTLWAWLFIHKKLFSFISHRSAEHSKKVLPGRLVRLSMIIGIVLFSRQLLLVWMNWFGDLTSYNQAFQLYWLWILFWCCLLVLGRVSAVQWHFRYNWLLKYVFMNRSGDS